MKTVMGRHEAMDGLPAEELFRPKAEGGSTAWKQWTALGGLVGAPVSGALGAVTILAGYLLGDGEPGAMLTLTGNVLLFSVVPLLLVGATALDWIEKDLRERERARASQP